MGFFSSLKEAISLHSEQTDRHHINREAQMHNKWDYSSHGHKVNHSLQDFNAWQHKAVRGHLEDGLQPDTGENIETMPLPDDDSWLRNYHRLPIGLA